MLESVDWETVAFATVAGAFLLYAFVSSSSSGKKDTGLSATEWRKFELTHRESISHNTRRFRFALQTESTVLGLPVGKHMSVRIPGVLDPEDETELLERPYTPVSSDDERGYFELVVKIYASGKLTPKLDALQVGDCIEALGPKGRVTYADAGEFHVQHPMRRERARLGLDATADIGVVTGVRHICMIAGGTGITPMLQVMAQVAKDQSDHCYIYMIFANVSVDDILVRDELEDLAQNHENITLVFTVDKGPEDAKEWDGFGKEVGFVTQELVEKYFPKPADDVVILECGPPRMMQFINKFLQPMAYKYIRY